MPLPTKWKSAWSKRSHFPSTQGIPTRKFVRCSGTGARNDLWGQSRSAMMFVGRDTTVKVQTPLRVGNTWTMPPGLVVVFVALQLCAGLKYLHVGLIEIKIHHSQSKKSAGVSNKKGFDASLPGFSGFPMPSGRRFLSRDYQRAFERAAQGNLLLLETTVLPLYRDLSMRLSHGTLVTLLPLPMISKPLQKGYTLLKTSTDERLCGLPTLYRREDDAKLLERASYYNHLHAVWPSVHFYVFPVPFVADWYAMAGLYGSGTEPHLAGDRYLRKFRTVLDPAIGYTWVAEGCSFQDAIAQYYRTDHHWNFPARTRSIGNYGSCCIKRIPTSGRFWSRCVGSNCLTSSSTGLGPFAAVLRCSRRPHRGCRFRIA